MKFRHSLSTRFLSVDTFFLLLCLVLTALYSSFGRPIWIDEFLHFALGSHHSTVEAWDSISKSIAGSEVGVGVNHGQTGIYMLIDYWLMQIFGADSFWLRFPSIISGLALFFCSLYLFRIWKMPFFWQLIGILGLFSQRNLMYFVGEARPYIVLAAASVCTLAYYSTPLTERTNPKFIILGLVSIVVGVLFHPYFSIYWLAIVIFTYWKTLIEHCKNMSINSIIRHINLPILVVGITLYFTLGSLTWLRRIARFDFDPFQWIKNDGLIKTFLDISHFQFLQGFTYPLLTITIAIIFIIVLLTQSRKIYLKKIIVPTTLLLFTLAISAFLSYVSFKQNYWILPRQWVASEAISVLAFVWLAYEISQYLTHTHLALGFLSICLYFTPILVNSCGTFISNYETLTRTLDQNIVNSKGSLITSLDLLKVPSNNDEWVDLANKNIQQGGKVYQIFRAYYGKKINGENRF